MEASIQRHKIEERIARLSGRYPVTAILGARQTGKTTLCRDLASSRDHYFDLERPSTPRAWRTMP